MNTFDSAFDFMMLSEDYARTGVVTTEPDGAQARFGINSSAHPKAVSDGFYTMDTAEALEYAKKIYSNDYWLATAINRLPTQDIANKIFDIAVNASPKEAILILQKALISLGAKIKADGSLNPSTIGYTELERNYLLPIIRLQQKVYYEHLVSTDPAKYSKYLAGWLARSEK